jgi:hypothetical protein
MVMALMFVLGLTASGGSRTEAQEGGEELFDLPIIKVNCTELPPAESAEIAISMAFGTAGMDVCDPGVGVTFTVNGPETNELLGSCVTELNPPGAPTAGCSVAVPYGTTVAVTEDLSTAPGGYVPLQNPLMIQTPAQPIADGIPPSAGFLNLLHQEPVAEPTEEPPAGPTLAPQETAEPVVARPAHIHRGTCDHLASEPRYDLTDLTVPTAEAEGAKEAAVAEASVSVIDVSIDALLATDYSVHVHASHDNLRTYVACGEIGGARRADGSLAVGLREVNGSGYEGIAYLAPDADDPGKTDVWVFIAPKLAEEDRPTAITAASPEAGTPVAAPAAG